MGAVSQRNGKHAPVANVGVLTQDETQELRVIGEDIAHAERVLMALKTTRSVMVKRFFGERNLNPDDPFTIDLDRGIIQSGGG